MSLTDYNISIIFGITFIMVIWLNSDIVQTIAKLTNARSLFKLDEYQLYNLKEDISQKNNLAKSHAGLLKAMVKDFELIRGKEYKKVEKIELK